MKVNKMVFWISFFVMIICIVLISIFAPLNAIYGLEIYAVVENIFISLIGGTWISMMTSVAGYHFEKKQNIISFCNEYTNILNKIKRLHNWFNLQYDDIKYHSYNEMKETLSDNDLDEFIKTDNNINNEKVHQFYERIKDIESYNYDKMYECMDDFCAFRIAKISPIRSKMMEMVRLVYEYNVSHMDSVHFTGYETGIYDEYILFKNLCPKFQKVILENPIDTFHIKRQEFLELTKINDYFEKDYKRVNESNQSQNQN